MNRKSILKKKPVEKKVYDFIKNSQEHHWWFVGRKKIIEKILLLYYPQKIQEALDIGSGYGAMVTSLKLISEQVDAIEPLLESKEELQKIGVREVLTISSFPNIKLNKKYNLISMFDVLEHIKDHEKALQTVKELLVKPGGRIILTVPAYNWLWSSHDVANHHFRRYTKKELINLLITNGYKNIQVSYFMTFLFPIALLQRILMKWNLKTEEYKSLNPILNFFLKIIFSSEAHWIQYFPYIYGLSVLVVAEV